MQKIFLQYQKSIQTYVVFNNAQTQNFILQDLWNFLQIWGLEDISWLHKYGGMMWESVRLSRKNNEILYLYNSDAIKQRAALEFSSQQEQIAFDQAYREYCKKRWDDMPILYMTIENYVEIVQKWQKIVLQERPDYIILSQDNTGYVDLVGRNELSEQDLADMQCEHEKYLKYKAAYDKYVQSRPGIVDELWHGPESSEYESDWQKFLDEPLDT